MAQRTRKAKAKLIANMGLFWRKESVLWRGNRRAGQHRLTGKQHGKKRMGPVNFWGQVGIYALYADYKLVYVGQAGLGDKACIGARLNHHTRDDLAGRWDQFSWFGLKQVRGNNTLGARRKRVGATWPQLADVLEGVLIAVADPPQNSQKGRFGPDVRRYLQDPHVEERNDDIAADVKYLSRQVQDIDRRYRKEGERIIKKLDGMNRVMKKVGKRI